MSKCNMCKYHKTYSLVVFGAENILENAIVHSPLAHCFAGQFLLTIRCSVVITSQNVLAVLARVADCKMCFDLCSLQGQKVFHVLDFVQGMGHVHRTLTAHLLLVLELDRNLPHTHINPLTSDICLASLI